MREKVSEGPEDRHGAPVLRGDCGERLDEMRMPTDDEIGPVVGQKLRPRGLHLIRLGLAFLAPVGEDDDKVSGSLCSVEIGGDRVEGRELVDHPLLLRRGIVQAADLKQIQKALAFLTPTCQMSREAQRDLMGASLKTTALLSSCR